MSVTDLSSSSSDPRSKLFHKPIHHRNDSDSDDDELDVFEAAKYFSGYIEPIPHFYTTAKNRASQNRAPSGAAASRMSLDMPMANPNIKSHQSQTLNVVRGNGKPHKQPSSPGGKLASFLNTLFQQAAGVSSKKNKKKPQPPKSAAEDDDGARRKRRSSISHLTRSFGGGDTRTSWYSTTTSSSMKSGFMTPPRPTKTGLIRTVVCGQNQKPVCRDSSWLDEKLGKLSNEKSKSCKFVGGGDEDEDDGGDQSDSSSDLFELQNYDVDAYSTSGLPVYETTDVGSITSTVTI